VVALEAGGGALLPDVGLGNPIQLQQVYAGLRGPGGNAQRIGRQAAGLAQLVDLFAALVADLFAVQDSAPSRLSF